MRFFADLHLHSHFSRATSSKMNVLDMSEYAEKKGVNLLGTGDFQHPEYLKELKAKLEPTSSGLFKLGNVHYVLQTEIANIYSHNGRGRKVHHIILVPDFETADKFQANLLKWGRIDYDGRPIFGKSSQELVKMVMDLNPLNEVIPAHIWTPWFSLFGANSGYDSIEECYGPELKHIHALETGLSCYDEKTEVLTDNGWKSFTKVKYSDKICTLNVKTERVEFQRPIRIYKYKHKGKMYKLKTRRVDLLVTPNHNLLVSHCDFRKSPIFVLKKAEDVINKSKRFKKDGVWVGNDVKYFVLPAVKIRHGSRYYSGYRDKKPKKFLIKPWLKFFGFWLAEGWTTQGKNGHYAVCLSNTNKELMNEMKNILESFGYNVFYDDKVNHTIRIRDYQLFHYLKQFGKCYDKFVPKEIKSLSKELLELLFYYYIKGDGHVYGRTGKGLSATTTSIHLRDDLQELALKLGMSAYYKLHNKKGTPFSSPSQGKMYYQNNDSWNIYFIRQNIHTVMPSIIRKNNYVEAWVDFDGFVYSVSVPNHVIYVRRNGVPVWCGNSDPEMNWRLSQLDKFTLLSNSDSHSPWPWRMGRECNVFDIQPSYKALIESIRTRKGLEYTIEVDPAYGKYHWSGHRKCGLSFSPAQIKSNGVLCPSCGKPLTIGVEQRVEELADRPLGFKPESAIPFKKLIPLSEIIAKFLGKGVATKTVWGVYNSWLERFKTEFHLMLDASREEILSFDEMIGRAILKVRDQQVEVKPGFDGEYGIPVFNDEKSSVTGSKTVKPPSQPNLKSFL